MALESVVSVGACFYVCGKIRFMFVEAHFVIVTGWIVVNLHQQ